MIYSFDIFDTCITRACGSSENIFYLLALDFIKDKDESKIMGFIMDRKRAECDAGQELNKECPTIDDIYSFFDTSVYTNVDKEVVKRHELEMDIESFIPVKRTMALLNEARKKGKVIFISDMYFSHDHLYAPLVNLGVIEEGENLYVSSDIGISKCSGRLFDYIKEKERISYKNWVHYGDDLHNDYNMPRIRGIKSIRISTSSSSIEAEWENESRLLGDKNISVMAGIIRSVRLQNYSTDSDEFVPDIMAACFVPFVSSVMSHAQRNGIKKLYFAARDARLMFLLAKQQNSLYNIEVKYLHISTKVLYPTFIKNATTEELRYIIQRVPGITGYSVLKLFGYSNEDIKNISLEFDLTKELYDVQDINCLSNEMIKGRRQLFLKQRCKEMSSIVMEYLKQESLIGDKQEKVGLVDIGWSGTSQAMLKKLFPNNHITYYYWGTSDIIRYKDTGSFVSFCNGEQMKEFGRINRIVECYMCRTTEGSTLAYKGNNSGIFPVLGSAHNDLDYEKEIRNNESIVLQVGEIYARYYVVQESAELFHKACSLRALQELVRYPKTNLINSIASDFIFSHYSLNRPIISKVYPSVIYKIIRARYLNTSKNHSRDYEMFWWEASIVYTYGIIGEWLIKHRITYILRKIIKTITSVY